MTIPMYVVDAFTSAVFAGNPAAVCLLEGWLDDSVLQAIAAENNLSETAFLVRSGSGFEIRWFTPRVEVALCGHATLASAFVLFTREKWAEPSITFYTRKAGELRVLREDERLTLDFPSRPPMARPMPVGLADALGATPREVWGSAEDVLVVLDTEEAVRGLQPRWTALERVEGRGIIVTAPGTTSDFVSRFFAPRVGILEDPVTGSAHCVLVPYWAERLGRSLLHAIQVSARGGELWCRNEGERVLLSGQAALYLEGRITLP